PAETKVTLRWMWATNCNSLLVGFTYRAPLHSLTGSVAGVGLFRKCSVSNGAAMVCMAKEVHFLLLQLDALCHAHHRKGRLVVSKEDLLRARQRNLTTV